MKQLPPNFKIHANWKILVPSARCWVPDFGTLHFFCKNSFYKNHEAQIAQKLRMRLDSSPPNILSCVFLYFPIFPVFHLYFKNHLRIIWGSKCWLFKNHWASSKKTRFLQKTVCTPLCSMDRWEILHQHFGFLPYTLVYDLWLFMIWDHVHQPWNDLWIIDEMKLW